MGKDLWVVEVHFMVGVGLDMVTSSEVALGIFGMKIVLKVGCCVDEA